MHFPNSISFPLVSRDKGLKKMRVNAKKKYMIYKTITRFQKTFLLFKILIYLQREHIN